MAFLFKSKKGQNSALPPTTRDIHSPGGTSPSAPNINGVSSIREKERERANNQTPTPGSSVNNSLNSLSNEKGWNEKGNGTPSPEQKNLRERPDHDVQAPRNPPGLGSPPNNNPNASLYPWSQRRLTFTTSHPNPFPRYGAAVNSVSSKEGDVYLMGGLINGSTVKGDLWMVEAGGGNLACYPIATTSEGPGPRVGHASLLVGNAFIVFGGDTKLDDRDMLDDTLYLLNTSTRQWSRALPAGARPAGRYGHTLNILGSKIYIFGGQVEGFFFNDLVAFDLNALQSPSNRWEMLIQSSNDRGPPSGQIPPARTNHTIINWNDKLYLFGGTNGLQWFNDVWAYDPRVNAWSQLDCIGYIPAAREGHAAALVNDVMYIFGGRSEDGNDLGDLAAFRISSRRWYTFQNMGPSPSPRSGHSMTAYGKQIVVLAGEPSMAPRDPSELSLVYLLDTAKIRYPNDQQIQQTPAGERVQNARRPSGEKNGITNNRGPPARDQPGPPLEGPKRINGPPRESTLAGPNSLPRNGEHSIGRGVPQGPGPQGPDQSPEPAISPLAGPVGASGGPGSRLPRASMAQGPAGPPPQQQAPAPRVNGAQPAPSGPRSRTPTRLEKGYGPPVDTVRTASFDKENRAPMSRDSPSARDITPIASPPPAYSPQQTKVSPRPRELVGGSPVNGTAPRPRSRQERQQASLDSIEAPGLKGFAEGRFTPVSQEEPSDMNLADTNPNDPISKTESTMEHDEPTMPESPSIDTQKNEALIQELDAAKSQNAWYASELALARKAGYQPNASTNPILDERVAEHFGDDDSPLLEVLLAMRAELAKVQGSVDSQAILAAQKVAEVEKQRDVAIGEAVYAKARLAAHGGSQNGTPQLDYSSRDIDDPNTERSTEINRKLANSLAAQNELRVKFDTVIAENEAERRARQLAEETLNAAEQRASELETYKQANSTEVETLRAKLHDAEKIARDESAQSVGAIAEMKILRIDKEELCRKLDGALNDSRNHVTALSNLKDAVGASADKSSLLERKLEEERSQVEVTQSKLLQLRAEHEERTTELETMMRRLKDAEELAETHAAEARTHRQAVLSGLDKATSRGVDDLDFDATDERVTILHQQVETANALVGQNQEAANVASEKLRRAEERIAGLEAYQEQASREGLAIRKQLQVMMREAQSLQSENADVRQRLESQQLDANAITIQHSALKDLLNERGISAADIRRSRSIESPGAHFSSPDQTRLRELEQELESSQQAHDETKSAFEAREHEADKAYREKLEQLENDYQSAVHYVKGTEKMLKRMKDELSKSKTQSAKLQTEVEEMHRMNASRDLEHQVPADWEQERQSLHREIESIQENVKSSMSQLERQMQEVRSELNAVQEERDHYRESNEQAQQHLATSSLQSRADLEQLKSENAQLESRALDAEKKVSLLLDQVESSVDSYRRQSQQVQPNGVMGHMGHQRNLSNMSGNGSIQESVYGPDNRTSVALDSLASELDALRTHWETTNKNYRLSSQFDFERTPTSAHGDLSDSLASWRKRLDLEEMEAEEKRGDGQGSHEGPGNRDLHPPDMGSDHPNMI
ncbi:MAG: Negative regulator of mitotic exit [Pycnora praestabilis]|nr:MAG: Negative regulator of mitotic exit [Pycnora praestabilis]